MTDSGKRPAHGMGDTFAERLRDAVTREKDKVCFMRLFVPSDDDDSFYDQMVLNVIGDTLVCGSSPFQHQRLRENPENILDLISPPNRGTEYTEKWKAGEFDVNFLNLEPGFLARLIIVDLAKLPEPVVQRISRVRAAGDDIFAISEA